MISELLKFLGINSSDSDITKEPKMKSEDNGTGSNITKERQNQPIEIEFWDIEPEDVPELEESDILTNLENMLMKKEMYYLHQRWMQYDIKMITRTIIIDKIIKVSYFILFIL